jgi:hypothetical protein
MGGEIKDDKRKNRLQKETQEMQKAKKQVKRNFRKLWKRRRRQKIRNN